MEGQINKGLTSLEAKEALKKYGKNVLKEETTSWLQRIMHSFWGPIPWMIELAAILSLVLARWPDFIMITALLMINGALELAQNFKADNAMAALKNKLALKARVKRDGKWQSVLAETLVPGDIVSVKLGNIIPADIKLLEGDYLSVDQSALTGESLPVDKKTDDIIYSGSTAKLGEMIGIVQKTGMNTYFGKTAQLVSSAKNISHFQKNVVSIGHFLIVATLLVCAIMLGHDLLNAYKHHALAEEFGDSLIYMLVLVVAGIPVALPAVLSVTMAIGASHLAKLKTIVTKLTAIEELAGINMLCTDKTGTLTKNQLKITQVHGYNQYSEDDVLAYALLASANNNPDAIDETVIQACKTPIDDAKVIKFIPFDPIQKKTLSTVEKSNKTFEVAKGATQVIFDLCVDKDSVKAAEAKVDELANKGYRTLAVAKKENQWELVGLFALYDPPREDTKSTLAEIMKKGVDVKMITGDHVAIAKELARDLNLGDDIHVANELVEDKSRENYVTIMKANGFAEVLPAHKFGIVKALQAHGNIVGMTGDGVNDAPALKQADVGIAVAGATDAARASADLVLTESGLSVITHAIEQARQIFGRMKSYSMYRISETVRLLLFLLAAILIYNTHPLTALMIILIALLNDIPIMMIAYDNMEVVPKPAVWSMQEITVIAVGLAIVGVISTFGLYYIGDHYWFTTQVTQDKLASLRTISFMGILCGGNLTIYLTRNRGFIWQRPLPEWKFFLATLCSLIIGTLLSVYGIAGQDGLVGIGWRYVGYCWAYIFAWFLFTMVVKVLLYKLYP